MALSLKGTVKPGQPDRRYYMIRVQANDRRVVVSSGTRDRVLAEKKEQAVIKALEADRTITQAEVVALVRGQEHVRHQAAIRSSGGLTLSVAFTRCFADPHVWRNIRAHAGYLINTKHVMEHFGADRVIESISRQDVQDYIKAQLDAKRASGLPANSPATINRRLACLGRMFSAMSECDDGPKSVPKIKYLPEHGARKFSFTHEQEVKMFDAIAALDVEGPGPQGGHPRKQDRGAYLQLFKVLVETGMRLGEAMHLRWSDVQQTPNGAWVIKLFRVDEIKTKKARTVPLTEACVTVLDELRSAGTSPIGPFRGLNKRRAQTIWTQAKDKAGITDPHCVIHALRHTCATRLLKATGNLVLVKEWLGHTTIKTTADTYAHVESDSMMEGAAALTALRGTSVARK